MRTPEEKAAAKLLKEQKKAYKKRVVEKYGYVYYLRDITWNNVKNQREDEDRAAWEHRLHFYGFTADGVDIRSGKKHHAKPMVYEDEFETKVELELPVEEAAATEPTEEVAEEVAEVAEIPAEEILEVTEEDKLEAAVAETIADVVAEAQEELALEAEEAPVAVSEAADEEEPKAE